MCSNRLIRLESSDRKADSETLSRPLVGKCGWTTSDNRMIYGTGQRPHLTTVWLSACGASRYKWNWWRELDSNTGLRLVCRSMGASYTSLFSSFTEINEKYNRKNQRGIQAFSFTKSEVIWVVNIPVTFSPKCWYLTTKLHVTSQEIVMLNQPLHQATEVYRRVEVNAPTVFIPVETNDSHCSYVILYLILRFPTKSSRTNINLICGGIIESGPLQGLKDLAN